MKTEKKLSYYLGFILLNDYFTFKNAVILKCKWTKDQWLQRRSGRTSLSPLEQEACAEIVVTLYPDKRRYFYGDTDGSNNAEE